MMGNKSLSELLNIRKNYHKLVGSLESRHLTHQDPEKEVNGLQPKKHPSNTQVPRKVQRDYPIRFLREMVTIE